MPSALNACNAQTYEGIRKLLCPYCAVDLPAEANGDFTAWVHTIPNTSAQFNCMCSTMRKVRHSDGAEDA